MNMTFIFLSFYLKFLSKVENHKWFLKKKYGTLKARNSDDGLGLSDVYIWFSYTTGNMLWVNAYNTPTKH